VEINFTYLRKRAGFQETGKFLSEASVDVVPTLSATNNKQQQFV
jgi:hypothetical protein